MLIYPERRETLRLSAIQYDDVQYLVAVNGEPVGLPVHAESINAILAWLGSAAPELTDALARHYAIGDIGMESDE